MDEKRIAVRKLAGYVYIGVRIMLKEFSKNRMSALYRDQLVENRDQWFCLL
jgi:hypothetical protein